MNDFCVKHIDFLGRSVPVLMQNENGPCPLLAICNVLLLRGQITLNSNESVVSIATLTQLVANKLLESNPVTNEEMAANQLKAIDDAISLLPSLQFGLDVNVRFQSVQGFEYTPQIGIFDMLGISLYHGWIVDPQDTITSAAVGDLSFNQVVEKVLTYDPNSTESDNEAVVLKQFLESTASQLTYYGLLELHNKVRDRELAVFFRNNHFCTIFKMDKNVYSLVTDQGFADEPNIVWEKLDEIDGNTEYLNASFQIASIPSATNNLVDPDYLLALSLQNTETNTNSLEPCNSGTIAIRNLSQTQDNPTRSKSQLDFNAAKSHALPEPYQTAPTIALPKAQSLPSRPMPQTEFPTQTRFESDYDLARKLQEEFNQEQIRHQKKRKAQSNNDNCAIL